MDNLIGKKYTFDDGDEIIITQIKIRDDNIPWVTYHIVQGPGIPRKLLMQYTDFIESFGHLFNIKLEDIEQENNNK
jgi:hypothetical protein